MTINGTEVSSDVEPRTLLVHFIREQASLKGTNIGCDSSSCGACTIHLNGESVKSCTVLAAQAAFRECHALQCGYCTPGMVMAAISLLDEVPNPTELEVREGLEGNLCRCTGYHNIVKAVLQASGSQS